MPFVPVASKVFVCGKPPLEPRCDVGPQNCQWIAFGSSVSLWVFRSQAEVQVEVEAVLSESE